MEFGIYVQSNFFIQLVTSLWRIAVSRIECPSNHCPYHVAVVRAYGEPKFVPLTDKNFRFVEGVLYLSVALQKYLYK